LCFSIEEEMKNILGGYWHQDVESTEAGLHDVFQEHSLDEIRTLIQVIEQFLNDAKELDYKRRFIDYWADGVNFSNCDPVEWLRDIQRKMVEYVQGCSGA